MGENSYIDTQGMTLPGKVPTDSQPVEYKPPVFKKMTVFTDMERKELKQMFREVLDERFPGQASHGGESNEAQK